ncbi:MAG: HAMP domain-containing histidine kinase [Bacteroidetes bacterium]|nr:HAMP domain-containing histidine kinase [Bacteroidota bacterium]MBS1650137.1 HAMP domain-containing histidine kinase [Bacteroidota bacterium]
MFNYWFNWKTLLAFIAINIVAATIFYSQHLAQKLKTEERKKVEVWVEAQKTILNATDKINLNLASKISSDNIDIPIIETDEKDNPTGNFKNLDAIAIKGDKNFLLQKLTLFKKQNKPIEVSISQTPLILNKYYYGESKLQQQIRYYPIIQLIIIGLFITVLIIAQRSNYQNTQNRLWAGMAKETAHQLGTPVSSLGGWVEILKEQYSNENFVTEIEKDVMRLQLVTNRFGKIGSRPTLEMADVVSKVKYMVDYIKKRAGGNVQFIFHSTNENIYAKISPPLFDWVIENLLKNALDAMEGNGKIIIDIIEGANKVIIDLTDTGKGISKANINKVFKPGFTTKKRGWGLGLTLTKRIVEQYHKGKIFIVQSELGKGTTFRITLNK